MTHLEQSDEHGRAGIDPAGPVSADSADFSLTDDSPQPGVNPYWVRVLQSDMEMAG